MLIASDDTAGLDGCRLFRYELADLPLEAFATPLMAGQPSIVTPVRLDAGEAVRVDLQLSGPEVAQPWVIDPAISLEARGSSTPKRTGSSA